MASSSVRSKGFKRPMDQYMQNKVDDENEGMMVDKKMTRSEHRNHVSMKIGRFLFENGIPLDCATSPSFINMLRSAANYGPGLKPPTTHEMETWILKEEVKTTSKTVDEIKATWKRTGVSLLLDSWSDINNKSMINFLVNNRYGTVFLKTVDASNCVTNPQKLFELIDSVIEEIGEEIVIQVVSDNTSEYKLGGNMLMEKRKSLYWTPCVAHSIDLMLEKIAQLPQQKNVLLKAKKVSRFIHNHQSVLSLLRKFTKKPLLRPTATRFATAFLTLENMYQLKQPLQMMFVSNEWWDCIWSKNPNGNAIRTIILDETTFWPSVEYFIKTTKPLVDVLRMVVGEKTPAMGFIYGAMIACKENIAKNFDGDVCLYKEIWDIIDQNWESRLYRDLHATAYYLNPRFRWSPDVSEVIEIKYGLFTCMEMLIKDEDTFSKANLQLDKYYYKREWSGCRSALTSYLTLPPVEWWDKFGGEVPELKLFATKILGLTCTSSSVCERDWNTMNRVHTKRRNRLSADNMNDAVYIMYNNKLKEFFLKKKALKEEDDPLVVENVCSDDEWIVDPNGVMGTLEDEGEDDIDCEDDG